MRTPGERGSRNQFSGTSRVVVSALPTCIRFRDRSRSSGGRIEAAAPVEQLALSMLLLGNANNATDGGPKKHGAPVAAAAA